MCRIVIYECDDVNHVSTKCGETLISCNPKAEHFRVPEKEGLIRFATEIKLSHVNLPKSHKLIFVENEKDEDYKAEDSDLYCKPEIESSLIEEDPVDSNYSSPRTTAEDDNDFIAEPDIETSLIEEELMDSNIPSPRSTEEIYLKQEINKDVENIDESAQDPIDPSDLQCPSCKKVFRRLCMFNKHISRKGRKYKCSLCCQGFNDSERFNIHMRQHSDDNKVFKCNNCPETFQHRQELERHQYEEEIKNRKIFMCDICKVYFPQKASMEKHMVTHLKKKDPLTCHICSKVIKSKKYLQTHLKIHTQKAQKESFLCPTCGKIFSTRDYLRKHKNRIHDPNKKLLKCTICEKIFTSNDGLRRHKKMHTGENLRNFKCTYCDKSFIRNSHLKRHAALHVKYNQFDGAIVLKYKKKDKN